MMCQFHWAWVQMMLRGAARRGISFFLSVLVAVMISPPVAAADPPREILITRQATIAPKDKGGMTIRFEAELKLRPAAGGLLKGEATFHCAMQTPDGGFVLQADHQFVAQGTWDGGRVHVSGPERLEFVCKKSHFDPAHPGPNPEGAWKPGDTDTFGLAPEFYIFDATLKEGRYEPPEKVFEKNNGVWRITTRMTAAGDTPSAEETNQTPDTTDAEPDDDGQAPAAGVIWTSEVKTVEAFFYDDEHTYSMQYKLQATVRADGGVTVRAFDIEQYHGSLSDEDIPATPDDSTLPQRERGSYPLPIRHEWEFFQIKPAIEIHVEQNVGTNDEVVSTFLLLDVNGNLTGIAKKQGKAFLAEVAAEAWQHVFGEEVFADRYGPGFDVEDRTMGGANFNLNSKSIPALNQIPKEKFHVVDVKAAVYPTPKDIPPPPAQKEGEDIPLRTYIKSISGNVVVKRAESGLWVEARPNMDLEIGDQIMTSNYGRAEVVLAGTAIVRVRPSTQFTIPQCEENSRTKIGFIQMVKGFLWVYVEKEKRSLKVATPHAICGVRGTEFTIDVTTPPGQREELTCVHCYEGQVEVWPVESGKEKRETSYLLSPDEVPSICLPLRTMLTVTAYAGEKRPGAEVKDMTVIARRKGASIREAVRGQTDGEGRVILRLPDPTEEEVQYEVIARSDRYGVAAKTVPVTANQHREVTLLFEQAGDDGQPDVEPVPPPAPDDVEPADESPPPAAPREVTVELKSGAEHQTCQVAAGGTVIVRVADYGASGYGSPKLVSSDSNFLTLRGTTTEPMRKTAPGGRPLEGAGQWKIFRFQAGSRGGQTKLVFEKQHVADGRRVQYVAEVTIQ